MGVLIIKPVLKNLAKDLILEHHYSHTWQSSFGIYNFGIFRELEPDRCLGVAVYGLMKNSKAKIFECAVEGGWMIELNRMWISDELGHNAETILIGASIRLLRTFDPTIVAVQSFADGRLGCGTIYKAANFKYYGYHITRFFRNKSTGAVKHEQTLTNSQNRAGFLRLNVELLLGNLEAFDVRTYRYIYPLHKSFKFKKQESPYPPYNKGTMPATETIKPDHLVTRITDVVRHLAHKYPHKK